MYEYHWGDRMLTKPAPSCPLGQYIDISYSGVSRTSLCVAQKKELGSIEYLNYKPLQIGGGGETILLIYTFGPFINKSSFFRPNVLQNPFFSPRSRHFNWR